MEPSKLADRLRGILKPPDVRPPAPQPSSQAPQVPSSLERVLGGEWRREGAASCFTVEKRLEPGTWYGRTTVGDLAATLHGAAADAPLIASGPPAQPPFVFFDLETTGLSGGAGTYAFLVGCGWFDEKHAFVTRQYLLTQLADERSLLATVADALARAGALVTFNGKSFDAPVLETRYLFHRLEWIGGALPHLDVLHPARRFWGTNGAREIGDGAGRALENARCSLAALEESVLGVTRGGDVPGLEIPARYFRFVRSGDARALGAVFEHNRSDLLALAGLTIYLLELLRSGPAAARDAREALALGGVYWRAGLEPRAREAYSRALTMTELRSDTARPVLPDPIRIAALRALALAARRARHFDQAASYWLQLLEVPGCPGPVAREAVQALAIHHEHRARDLVAARAFALRSLDDWIRPACHEAARHRLARIERKLARETRGAMLELRESMLELGD